MYWFYDNLFGRVCKLRFENVYELFLLRKFFNTLELVVGILRRGFFG